MTLKIKGVIVNEIGSIARSIRDMIIVGLGLATMRLSSLVISVLLARYSNVTTFGQYTLFLTVFVIASEIPSALDSAYIKHANDPHDNSDTVAYRHLAIFSKVLIGIIAILSILLLIVFNDTYDTDTFTIVSVAVVSGLLVSIYTTHVAKYQQIKQYSKFSLLKPLPHIFILLSVLSVSIGFKRVDIDKILYIYLSAAILFSIIAISTVFREKIDLGAIKSSARRYIRVAIILLLTSIIGKISGRFDVLILTRYLSFDQLSQYGVALRTAMLLAVMTSIISIILYSKAPSVQNSTKAIKRYMWLSVLYFLPVLLLAVALIVWVDKVILLFFGVAYLSDLSIHISRIFILVSTVVSATAPFQALIQTGRRPQYLLYIILIKSIVSVPLLLFFVPKYGIVGAASIMLLVSLLALLSISISALVIVARTIKLTRPV